MRRAGKSRQVARNGKIEKQCNHRMLAARRRDWAKQQLDRCLLAAADGYATISRGTLLDIQAGLEAALALPPSIALSELWDLLFPEGTHTEYDPPDAARWLDAYTDEIEAQRPLQEALDSIVILLGPDCEQHPPVTDPQSVVRDVQRHLKAANGLNHIIARQRAALLKSRLEGLRDAYTICEEYRKREYGPHGTEWVSCEDVNEVKDEIAEKIRELEAQP